MKFVFEGTVLECRSTLKIVQTASTVVKFIIAQHSSKVTVGLHSHFQRLVCGISFFSDLKDFMLRLQRLAHLYSFSPKTDCFLVNSEAS